MAYKRLDRRFSEDSPPAQEITSLRSDPPLCCYGQAGRLPRSWAHHMLRARITRAWNGNGHHTRYWPIFKGRRTAMLLAISLK